MRNIFAVVFALLLVTNGAWAYNEPTLPAGGNGAIQYNNNGTLGGLTAGSQTAGAALATLNGQQLYVTARPPSANDDATLGYVVGNLWAFGGRTWQNVSVTTGQSSWQIMPKISAPLCDIVTGCTGAYGVFRMEANYSGPAFAVTRVSDNKISQIPFDVTGVASWAMVDAFCSGTTCGISTWYDQSGLGNDSVQATAAAMPQNYGAFVGNQRAISFNGSANMTNSTMSITSVQNSTVTMIGRVRNSRSGNVNVGGTYFELGNPTSKLLLFDPVATLGSVQCTSLNGGTALTATNRCIPTTSPQVMTLATTGGVPKLNQNNLSTTFSGNVTNTSATGFQMGATNAIAGWYGQYDALGFVVYNSALSATNLALENESLYQATGIQPQVQDTFVFEGDSFTAGAVYSPPAPDQVYTQYTQALIKHPYTFYNTGVGTETACQMQSEAAGYATKLATPGANKVVTVLAGRNDLALSSTTTPATVYACLQSICTSYRGQGFKCVVGTVPPSTAGFLGGQTSAGYETARQSLSTMIRNGAGVDNDGVIDYAIDPVMGPQAAANNTTLYNTGVHPQNPAGTSNVANIFLRYLNPYNQ